MPISARIASRLVGWFHAPDAPPGEKLSRREEELLQARRHEPRRSGAGSDSARADQALAPEKAA